MSLSHKHKRDARSGGAKEHLFCRTSHPDCSGRGLDIVQGVLSSFEYKCVRAWHLWERLIWPKSYRNPEKEDSKSTGSFISCSHWSISST